MSCVADHKRGSGCIILEDNIVATIDRSDRIKETKDSEKYCRGSSLSFNCGGIGAKVRIFFFLLFLLFFYSFFTVDRSTFSSARTLFFVLGCKNSFHSIIVIF